jgi:hypothetical protein
VLQVAQHGQALVHAVGADKQNHLAHHLVVKVVELRASGLGDWAGWGSWSGWLASIMTSEK